MQIIREILTIRSQFERINVFALFVLTLLWLWSDRYFHDHLLSSLVGFGAVTAFVVQTVLDVRKLRRMQARGGEVDASGN